MIHFDARAESRKEREAFARTRRAEFQYGIKLRKIAKHVGDIVNSFPPGDPAVLERIQGLLRAYADMIRPWARIMAAAMLADVSRRDEQAWAKITKGMAADLREELLHAPTGEILRKLQAEQVELITSIPLEAAQRVHKLTMEGLTSARRYADIVDDIRRTSHVTESRATLIARTEVGRISTNLTQARALHVGSDGYIWRTEKDAQVRPSHRKMEGKLVKWSSPPTLDKLTGHAGALPNCFTGDTLISFAQKPRAIIRGSYSGPLVTLVVGEPATVIRATPNHPILTPFGWRAAGLLEEGDYIVQLVSKADRADVQKVEHKFIRFDEFFEAAVSVIEPQAFPVLDLYGDIINDEVQIVGLESDLPLDAKTTLDKRIRDHVISGADGRVRARGIERGVTEILESSLTGGGNLVLSSLRSSSGESEPVTFTYRPDLDAIAREGVIDGQRGRFEFACQCAGSQSAFVKSDQFRNGNIVPSVSSSLRVGVRDTHSPFLKLNAYKRGMDPDFSCGVFEKLAGQYQLVRLSDTRLGDFSGHVFSMETEAGYYGVGIASIASKNCRCYPEVVLPEL